MEADYKWRNLATFWTALNFSQNKIDKFEEFIVDYDNENRSIVKTHSNTDISFSPKSVIHAGLQFSILKAKKNGQVCNWLCNIITLERCILITVVQELH